MVNPKGRSVLVSAMFFVFVVGCGQDASTDAQRMTDGSATLEASSYGADDAKETPTPDAGREADGGILDTVEQVKLSNGLCLPNYLPMNGTGFVNCRIILTAVVGGCGQDGLSTASAADLAAVEANAAQRNVDPVSGPICEMTQLAEANCTAKSVLGWCYHHSSCLEDGGAACAQAICTTAGFEGKFISSGQFTGFSGAWLVCS